MKSINTPAPSRLFVLPLSMGLLSARVRRGIKALVIGTVMAGASLVASAATITSSSGFVNSSVATQSGTFTATFDDAVDLALQRYAVL
jgi:hypothetical protein